MTNQDSISSRLNMTPNSDYIAETDFDQIINYSSNVPKTVYVLQNRLDVGEAEYDRPDNEKYHNFNNLRENHEYTSPLSIDIHSETNITRRDMCNYLLKFFPDYEGDNNMVNIIHFLSNRMKCDCTDCGGSDSIGECEIETEYIKHFGDITHHNIV